MEMFSFSSSSGRLPVDSDNEIEAELDASGVLKQGIERIVCQNAREDAGILLSLAREETEPGESTIILKIASLSHPDTNEDGCIHTDAFKLFQKEIPDKFQQAISTESRKWCIVHYAIKSDCALLLDFLAKQNCCLTVELENDTDPLGLAAEWSKLSSMRYLIRTSQFDLKQKEQNGFSYLMRACLGLNIEGAKLLIDQMNMDESCKKRELLEYRSESEDSGIDLIFLSTYDCDLQNGSCKHTDMLEFIRNQTSVEDFDRALKAKNEINCTKIQHVAATSGCKILLEYLHKTRGLSLDEPDNDGDTALGDAAFCGKLSAIEYLVQNGSSVEHRNLKGETAFLHACRGLQFEAAEYLAEKAEADVLAEDYCDNTALHLTCTKIIDDENEHEFLNTIRLVIELMKKQYGEDEAMFLKLLSKENLSNHNVMMVLADTGNLSRILSEYHIGDLSLEEQCKILQNEAEGTNILHVYCGKHSLQGLEDCFLQSNFKDHWKRLIEAKVQKGFYKGYGCLHFACQAGHLENINYLLNNHPDSMRLSDSHCSNGPSPMDVLLKHRNSHLLRKIEKTSFEVMISVIDDVTTALKLPTVEEAKATLLPLCEPELKSAVMKPDLHKNEQYVSGRSSNDGLGDVQYSYGAKLLYLALKEDSVEIFRCILALGFWSYLKTRTGAKDFDSYIRHLINRKSDKLCIGDVLPSLQKGFNQYLSWSLQSDKTKICFDLPFPSLLGIAIRSGRINMAKDLIMLEQYDLIPTCLLVIEECQFLIRENKKVLRECVEDLQNFSLNVALNAMHELDSSADDERMKLLHKYMGARFYHSGQQPFCAGKCLSKNPDFVGPKYFSFGDVKREQELSVFELAIKSQSQEFIASKGFKNFSMFEWEQRQTKRILVSSPEAKFYIHFSFFIIFFGLLTYYVCRLEARMVWIDIVIAVFALSFFLQELIDFIQTVSSRRPRELLGGQLCSNLEEYFLNIWNWIDVVGIFLLLASICYKFYLDSTHNSKTKIVSSDYFAVRLVLTIAHVCWSFRLISFLRAFRHFGPLLSMLKRLIKRDLLPFLVIFIIICLSFGILFLNLLHPDLRSYTQGGAVGERSLLNLLSIYTRPLLTAFGEMEMEELAGCENVNAQWLNLNETALPSDAICTHPVGTFHYRKYLILPFLFLINLTMLNMLIAKFSLTVSSKEDVAYMIWRRYDAELLMDFKRSPILPPPLTVLWLPLWLFSFLVKQCQKKGPNTCLCCKSQESPFSEDMKFWWRHKHNNDKGRDGADKRQRGLFNIFFDRHSYNQSDDENGQSDIKKYTNFLFFQACTFRGKRSGFTKPRKDHGSVIEKLKVDILRLSSPEAM
ncbi:hypothetical protein BOX15_Mlig025640g1 [Macrostomum lignano]|uniref:Uncharacterized protein n=1 Tax=Macrostomum lignano TaxID=282301 RepID=A0A267GLX7_9PLAT|nr:hypothetical protein BOX15_Mlig025640g1 [Macrostomum lignano]